MASVKCPECSKEMIEGFVFAQSSGEGGIPGLYWQSRNEKKTTCLSGNNVRPQSSDAFRCDKDNMITFNYIGNVMKSPIIKCPECSKDMLPGKVYPIDDISDVGVWWKEKDSNEVRVDAVKAKSSIFQMIFGLSNAKSSMSKKAFHCENCKIVSFQY
ncbi:MAG: PF20097 family protein [Candidatus Altiarchaeota archaeon]